MMRCPGSSAPAAGAGPLGHVVVVPARTADASEVRSCAPRDGSSVRSAALTFPVSAVPLDGAGAVAETVLVAAADVGELAAGVVALEALAAAVAPVAVDDVAVDEAALSVVAPPSTGTVVAVRTSASCAPTQLVRVVNASSGARSRMAAREAL